MARIPYGILGEFTGNAGNVSGYMRMGANFIRSKRRKSTKPVTPARLAQQQKIKICHEFTRCFTGSGFFDRTFPQKINTATGYNKATSALMRKAITGVYPDISLSWPDVQISGGGMPSVPVAATTGGADSILFTWDDNAGTGTARSSDIAVLVAYFPAVKQAVFGISTQRRGDGMAELKTHGQTGEAHTWAGFISEDGKDAADSVYAGILTI